MRSLLGHLVGRGRTCAARRHDAALAERLGDEKGLEPMDETRGLA